MRRGVLVSDHAAMCESESESRAELYFAVLLTEINVDSPGDVPRYEESFVLLRADSDDRARDVASAFARSQEHSYLNQYGETVRWSPREIVSVERVYPWSQELTEEQLGAGMELWARSFTDLEAYIALRRLPDAARWEPGQLEA